MTNTLSSRYNFRMFSFSSTLRSSPFQARQYLLLAITAMALPTLVASMEPNPPCLAVVIVYLGPLAVQERLRAAASKPSKSAHAHPQTPPSLRGHDRHS